MFESLDITTFMVQKEHGRVDEKRLQQLFVEKLPKLMMVVRSRSGATEAEHVHSSILMSA